MSLLFEEQTRETLLATTGGPKKRRTREILPVKLFVTSFCNQSKTPLDSFQVVLHFTRLFRSGVLVANQRASLVNKDVHLYSNGFDLLQTHLHWTFQLNWIKGEQYVRPSKKMVSVLFSRKFYGREVVFF